ncbi:Delta endotoxin central region subgroup 1 [Beauveria bassiana ARSEF 2860]|uniref:Delta endotoxin central region subgroup 1 n=1 Tax=Beauveria bassiana (strain ARSEF 2860) TaxID=655819 RepID=J4VVY9_BEAB2|nr:Delta endotoxin central region subgroup 1 [Beauveria bassiana ARSEF 2860]EJP62605.1 Delta endotoxin central region subgroup 1 [Beauveria bassiana ARSEF 2860]
MAFDHELAAKLAEKAIAAAQTGVKMNTNENEISQLVLSIFAIGLNAIPVVGGVISSVATLLGLAIFPAPSADPWTKVSERVETLIGKKLEEHQVKALQSRMEGFKLNANEYAKVWKIYNDAAPDKKKEHAELLRTHHVGFLTMMRVSIPEFQVDTYAALTLPLFAQAANLHLTLLADGIKHGLDWGYPQEYVANIMPDEFRRMTSSGNAARDMAAIQSRADNTELELLKGAIEAAERLGVAPELIAMWKEAYSTFIEQFATRAKRSTLDYVSHAKRYYTEGRKQVKPYEWVKDAGKPHYGNGYSEGLALQTYADYDLEMLENVLNYAEFWPYLTGESKMPESSLLNLDREVFRGPYIRYTENAPWSATSPPPVTKRTDRITAVSLCVSEDVRSLQVKYGDTWGPKFGECRKPDIESRSFELQPDEYIENVDIVYGHKLGQLQFTTNKGTVHGPYGDPRHADVSLAVNHTGYALTSMYSTHYERNDPEGIEGIFFGFRPLLTAKTD